MKRMLLVLAHPDDESFTCGGLIPKYVKEGWRVDLICATRGEVGKTGPLGELTQDALGQVRQKEVEAAGVILGVSSVSFLGYKDGTLAQQTPGEIEEKVYQKIMEMVPDIVITFDTTGLSNHPDHIKLCYATTFAFQKYASWVADQLKSHSVMEEDAHPKLYYACMPESAALYLKKKKIMSEESFGRPWLGTPDKFITTVINIDKFKSTKKKALKAHVSQADDTSAVLSLSSHPLLTHEYFILRMHGEREVFMGKNDAVANDL